MASSTSNLKIASSRKSQGFDELEEESETDKLNDKLDNDSDAEDNEAEDVDEVALLDVLVVKRVLDEAPCPEEEGDCDGMELREEECTSQIP